MGGALASALASATNNIILSDYSAEKAEELAKKLNCTAGDNHTVASECDAVFLAVKPQVLASVLEDIKDILGQRKPLIITMAAGVKIEKIENITGASLPIIRIMPNTPVAVGKGVILYCSNSLVSQNQLDTFITDMRFAGTLENLGEELMDIGCAVSGCGPAYMYMFVDAIADGAEKCGLSRDKAIKFAALTMSGAAEMVLQSDKTPKDLRIAVCSPGGSTIEGVKVLEAQGFKQTAADAIKAAYNRNIELGK